MHKKVISLILISIFLFSITLGSYTVPRVFALPKLLLVPSQYSTIQAAIDVASPGDIILVASGTYNESILIDKSIWLIAENQSNTIIDGKNTGFYTVHVIANNVKIEGFTIRNGESPIPSQAASLSIWRSKGHIISNNIIRQSDYGILIRESNNSRIVNNVITKNNAVGIQISSGSNNYLIGNLIENNPTGASITGSPCNNNTVYHNNFVDNTNQAPLPDSSTKWDNGTEGNYWSDYTGIDTNGDGIGNTELPHLSIDKYPLMARWENKVPIANFIYSSAEPKEREQIQFNDTSRDPDLSGAVVTWLWNFGDGGMSTQQNLTHTYMSSGTYTVTLTITDNKEATDTKVKTITVAPVSVPAPDNTVYYILAGVAAIALISAILLFVFTKKKKPLPMKKKPRR